MRYSTVRNIDDTSRLEQQILMTFPLKKSVSNQKVRLGLVRAKVQGLGFVQYIKNHQVEVNSKTLLAQHICASSWLKDKVRAQHPDSSPKCPNYEH